MNHLRFAQADEQVLRAELERIIRTTPFLWKALCVARDIDLPEWWLVSGAIYNTVWNVLTGRPYGHGIKDIDLFYFDTDTSWGAEDRVIQAASSRFSHDPPVEIRNQARVHLWYQDHFGQPYLALQSAAEGIDHFACKTHAVGVRLLQDGKVKIYAPFGLGDIFAFRLTPNPVLDNRTTHEAKAARQMKLWPELTLDAWP